MKVEVEVDVDYALAPTDFDPTDSRLDEPPDLVGRRAEVPIVVRIVAVTIRQGADFLHCDPRQ